MIFSKVPSMRFPSPEKSFMIDRFVVCKRIPGSEIIIYYNDFYICEFLFVFVDLNVFPHSWQGKESPSRCVSICLSRFDLAFFASPTAFLPQSVQANLPPASLSIHCSMVRLSSLMSSGETSILSNVATSLG